MDVELEFNVQPLPAFPDAAYYDDELEGHGYDDDLDVDLNDHNLHNDNSSTGSLSSGPESLSLAL